MERGKCTAIIILNYNNYEDTINCIQSVEQYNTAPVKYIVVDNGSTRGDTVDKLKSYFQGQFSNKYIKIEEGAKIEYLLPYLTFLISSTNDGYACGNNKGLELAYNDSETDTILILNNDILFVEDIIPKLKSSMQQLPDCGIISPILYKRNLEGVDYNCARRSVSVNHLIRENFFHYWYRLNSNKYANRNNYIYILKDRMGNLPEYLPIDLPSGSCMMIKKDLFKQIGSFDPHTFLYYEENILFKKIERIHLKNYLCTQLKCIHLGACSTSKTKNNFAIKCNIHSQRYYVKHYSNTSKLKFILYYFSTTFFKVTLVLQKKLFNVRVAR